MEKFRAFIKSVPITFESWFASFVAIVVVRIFFEQFSSFLPRHFVLLDLPTIIHYACAFMTIVILSMITMRVFTKLSFHEILVNSIFGLFIIWIVPIIDIVSGGVGGHTISYIFVSGQELLIRFTTFFGGNLTSGATFGVQTEVIIVIMICFTYIYLVTKNILRATLAAFTYYCIIFFLFTLPSLIALSLPASTEPFSAIMHSVASSQIIQNNIHPEWSATSLGLTHLGFNKTMIGVHTIIIILSAIFLLFLEMRGKLIAIIKNSRILRLVCYILMFVFGSMLAKVTFGSWVDILTYLLALIALTCAWLFSVCQNDIHDEAIDKVSNSGRPLVTKELSREDLDTASKIFLLFGFLAAYASGHYVMVFMSLFILLYYIYSNPPLRIKKFPILSSFLISLACLSLILAGFFLVSVEKAIVAFPLELILPTIILFTVVSNIRDIKDVEGDSVAGMYTLPVLLGVKRTKMLLGGAMLVPLLISPWYFGSSLLTAPAILVSFLSWRFINAENYKEWKIFVLYILYFILIIGVTASK